ncbi:MAG: hypothetical protein IPM54_40595 [Polyangiaceae bacterium]|nr:hypothetical protein [Polyangiaceae bacterium]
MRNVWPFAVVALVAAGCSEKKSTTIARWEGGDTGTKLVRVGDKLSYEARFFNENDEPTDPPYFNWTSFMSFNFPVTPDMGTVVHRHPSAGVYQVDVTINVMGPSFLGLEFAREPFGKHEKVSWDVVVAPPYATQLVPLHVGALRIAIGETRSIPAYTLSKARHQIGGERTFHTAEGVSATSAAPSIASTDERGRITGVSVGNTTITLRVNGLESPIEVEVVDEKLAPPADGTHPLLSTRLRSLTGGTWEDQPRLYQRLTFDPKGYPFTLAQPLPNDGTDTVNWQPLLLAEWTGTGFGATVASRFGEEVISPQLAVDERGLPYVAYRSSGWLLPQFVLADRDASGVFRHRELPIRRNLMTDSEQEQKLWVGGVGEDQTSTEIAILPRKGGGAFVAYAMSSEPTSEELICRTHVRLVEATDDALNTEEVLVIEYPFNPVTGICSSPTKSIVREIEGLGLVWPSDGGAKPDVVVQRFFASAPKSKHFAITPKTESGMKPKSRHKTPKLANPSSIRPTDFSQWLARESLRALAGKTGARPTTRPAHTCSMGRIIRFTQSSTCTRARRCNIHLHFASATRHGLAIRPLARCSASTRSKGRFMMTFRRAGLRPSRRSKSGTRRITFGRCKALR